MFAATNDYFVDNCSAVIDETFNVMYAQAKLAQKYNKYFGFQRKLFSRQQRKTRKKRQYWFRNCLTDKWWVDMMLAVAPVEDLWKKNFRLSRTEFDEICNELRPYISPNILESQSIASRKEGCCCIVFS